MQKDCPSSTVVVDLVRCGNAGSGGDHKTRLRQGLLTRMFDDNVMELLLVIAQHAHAVSASTTVFWNTLGT